MTVLLHPDFDAREAVILDGAQGGNEQECLNLETVGFFEYRSNRVLCEVDATTSGFLVLLDGYYPGWLAYVDGREAEILRANYAFRAVGVPEASGRIVCRPRSFNVGLTVTSVALLLGGVVALFRHRRRRSLRDREVG